MKVSVVITAYNSGDKIESTLRSVEEVADEIIVIDCSSTDDTSAIAHRYTDKVFLRENYPMLNTNKNYGFSKAAGDWILNLDSDESLTAELSKEILGLSADSDTDGYLIPRKNIIFGKWIEHTGWYPDYQLRLFRKNKGRFEEKHIHELLQVDGEVKNLTNPIEHLNYDSIDQFLNKMIKTYTTSEAKSLIDGGYKYNSYDIIKMPFSEFLKRYFAQEGYKDGMHGLVLSLLMSFYHFTVFLRLWEANKYPEEKEISSLLMNGKKMIGKETAYWILKNKIDDEKNIIKKQTLRIKRKILH